jgi:actin-like ATPase involved in cell morphogenesis
MTGPRPDDPAGLVGDVNSAKARAALAESVKRLPANIKRALNKQPVDLPAEVQSGGLTDTGRSLAALRAKLRSLAGGTP